MFLFYIYVKLRLQPVVLTAEMLKAVETAVQQETDKMKTIVKEESQQQTDDLKAHLTDRVEKMLTGKLTF